LSFYNKKNKVLSKQENLKELCVLSYIKEYPMIRFIGGLWRILNGGEIKSFVTYADALAYLSNAKPYDPAWEELGELYTTDDIYQQVHQ
jgi:hypothetical protein